MTSGKQGSLKIDKASGGKPRVSKLFYQTLRHRLAELKLFVQSSWDFNPIQFKYHLHVIL